MKPVLVCLALLLSAGAALTSAPENKIPQDVFDGMRQSFRADRARGIHARYEFDLSGPNGGHWWIEVNNGTCKIGRGIIANPNVAFVASDRDWVALSNGHLSGVWATVTGRLKISGDRALAHKLDEMFP